MYVHQSDHFLTRACAAAFLCCVMGLDVFTLTDYLPIDRYLLFCGLSVLMDAAAVHAVTGDLWCFDFVSLFLHCRCVFFCCGLYRVFYTYQADTRTHTLYRFFTGFFAVIFREVFFLPWF